MDPSDPVDSAGRFPGERALIEEAWADPSRRGLPEVRRAVDAVVDALDRGALRVAEPDPALEDTSEKDWIVHAWIKMAILLYFAQHPAEPVDLPPFHFRDKIPLKRDPEAAGIRVVPRPPSATAPFSSAEWWRCPAT